MTRPRWVCGPNVVLPPFARAGRGVGSSCLHSSVRASPTVFIPSRIEYARVRRRPRVFHRSLSGTIPMRTPVRRFMTFFVATFALVPMRCAVAQELTVPDNVIFEKGIEYANPDDQHLQVNIARP